MLAAHRKSAYRCSPRVSIDCIEIEDIYGLEWAYHGHEAQ